MWPSYHDAGDGLACVDQGITESHDLPVDLLSSWDHLVEPVNGEQELQQLAWEETPADLTPDPQHATGSVLSTADCTGHATAELAAGTQHEMQSVRGRRKQEINRLAQQRSRQKKQAHLRERQSQLAGATAELHQLKLQHKQLVTRNLLLEKSARLCQETCKKCRASDTEPSPAAGLHNITQQTKQGLGVVLTAIREQPKILTLDSIGQISHTEFASIYTIYARKIGQALVDLADKSKDSYTTNTSLRRFTSELNAMTHCLAAANPRTFQDFHNRRLDGQAGPVSSDLSEAFYLEVLTTKNLTDAQVQDLLHLRRMFYGRLGQLMRHRKQLLSQVPKTGLHPSGSSNSDAAGTDQLAQQLKTSGADEYQAYTTFASVFFRGVQTFKQHAVDIVAAYPWIPDKHRMLELLASQRGEPSVQFYLDGAGIDDAQHEASWQEVVEYLQSLNASNLHKHVPLLNNKPVQSVATWTSAEREKTVYDLLR